MLYFRGVVIIGEIMRYDIAQICENGHVINGWSTDSPEHNEMFCNKCGKPTITKCPECNAAIRGNVLDDFPNLHFKAPNYCINCGSPYPWIKSRLITANELVYELESINERDKAILMTSINDLVKETPSAPIAATKYKKIMEKVGTTTSSIFRDILVDVVSEVVKKSLFPTI